MKYAFGFFHCCCSRTRRQFGVFCPALFSQTEPIEFGVLLHTCMLCHQTNKSNWRVTKNGPLLKVALQQQMLAWKKGAQSARVLFACKEKTQPSPLRSDCWKWKRTKRKRELPPPLCICKRQPRVLVCKKKTCLQSQPAPGLALRGRAKKWELCGSSLMCLCVKYVLRVAEQNKNALAWRNHHQRQYKCI